MLSDDLDNGLFSKNILDKLRIQVLFELTSTADEIPSSPDTLPDTLPDTGPA
jgi:hypothetical protein